MKRAICFAAMIFAGTALAQSSSSEQESSRVTLRSTSTLVVVPTLVHSATGEAITGMNANHFRLTDDGVEQKVFVEDAGTGPIAAVVLIQTGGSARSQLQSYPNLGDVLDRVMGVAIHKIALVTFDSHTEQVWNFPPRADGVKDAFSHLQDGDGGAAILDAVNYGLGLLNGQPAGFRRVLFLISQGKDDGSTIHSEDLLRRLGESNVTIYSSTFSAERKTDSKRHAHVNLLAPSATCAACPDKDTAKNIPLDEASIAHRLREDTAAELAFLSGGQQIRFKDRLDLERQWSILTADIPSRYTLSFRPASKRPGFHTIHVNIVGGTRSLHVTTRAGYWLEESEAK